MSEKWMIDWSGARICASCGLHQTLGHRHTCEHFPNGQTEAERTQALIASLRTQLAEVAGMREEVLHYQKEFHRLKERAEKAEAELASALSENKEQARLLGMGGEREARLVAELAEAQRLLKRTQAAAISGMNAAKATSSAQLDAAQRLRTESSPEALESERDMNGRLTKELEKAEVALAFEKARADWLETLIMNAPHNVWCRLNEDTHEEECDCWISEALEGK